MGLAERESLWLPFGEGRLELLGVDDVVFRLADVARNLDTDLPHATFLSEPRGARRDLARSVGCASLGRPGEPECAQFNEAQPPIRADDSSGFAVESVANKDANRTRSAWPLAVGAGNVAQKLSYGVSGY
jgi:hypothetical protein